MRVFIGSSKEQTQLVDWLTSFITEEFGQIEPVPWTVAWESGKYTLENLEGHIRETDASILLWTPDDPSLYHGVERYEPRDNLLIEAGMFIAAHGRDRTQLLIPKLPEDDPRGKVAVPADFWGLTMNYYQWRDGRAPGATGLPATARTVCKRLDSLGPRPRPIPPPRPPTRLQHLAQYDDVDEVLTYIGSWPTMHVQGIRRLAADPQARSVDIMAAYRVGEIKNPLNEFAFKKREDATLRACFFNAWDVPLAEIYRRKYYDRTTEHMQHAVKESIEFLLGPCSLEAGSDARVTVTDVAEPPAADYDLRLTPQRITMGYYRVDDVAFIVPLDMKREQTPQPLAWVLDKSTAPGAFNYYLKEFSQTFEESQSVYRSR
jgi:hypothetical protein